MTVFMTPDKEVFFGGTYFHPRDVPGRVSMRKVLTIVLRMWKEERHKVKGITEALERAISEWKSQSTGLADYSSLEVLMDSVASSYDLEYGGLGNSTKFPPPYCRPGTDGTPLPDGGRLGPEVLLVHPEANEQGRHLRPGRRWLPQIYRRQGLGYSAL